VENIKIDLREIEWDGVDRIDLEREDGMLWTGSIWLRIGTSGGLL
jgi:hypothetical protein